MLEIILPIVCSVAMDRAVPDSADPNEKLKQLRRNTEISAALDPIETEFNKILKNSIQERAEEIESYHLQSLAMNWEAVDEHIDPHDVVYKDESAAIEWLVEQITSIENVELDDEAEQELRQILAAEIATVVESFIQRLADDDQLRNQFQTELQVSIRQELGHIQTQFEELAEMGPISRFLRFDADETDAVVSMIEPPRAIDFVSRPEVEKLPDAQEVLIVGVAGSGKTRMIERLLEVRSTEVDEILTPDPTESLFRQDQYAFERESFDGDVLLVWDDIHKINENQDNVIFEDVVSKLRSQLEADGHSLYVIGAARSGHLGVLPGSVRSPTSIDNRSEGFWGPFQTVELGNLSEEHTRQMVKRMGQQPDPPITFSATAVDTLAARAAHESGPGYLDAALKTADPGDELTVDDIETLPDEAIDIWVHQYEDLLGSAGSEGLSQQFEVLVACKLLYDLNLEYHGSLVFGICKHVLGSPETNRAYQKAVNQLVERRWLSVEKTYSGDETQLDTAEPSVTGDDSKYNIHDTQVEAVDNVEEATSVSIATYIEAFSDFLLDHADDHCPNPQTTSIVHGELATHLLSNDIEYSRMKQHYQRAVDQPTTTPINKSNYAFVLHQEGQTDLAETYYREALCDASPTSDQLDSTQTLAHLNYANLLKETNRIKEAKQHHKRALESIHGPTDEHSSIAHRIRVSLAVILKEEGKFDPAKQHVRRALEATTETDSIVDSSYQTGHNEYADLSLYEGNYSAAKTHFRRVLEISSPTANPLDSAEHIVHNNYAGLLHQDGELSEAEKHYRRGLELTAADDEPLNSDDQDMLGAYGKLLLEDDRPTEAIAYCKNSVLQLAEANMLEELFQAFDLLIAACEGAGKIEDAHSYCQSKLDLAEQHDLPPEILTEIRTRCDSLANQAN